MNPTVDLTILGGGLAGLSLALQCKNEMPLARIAVVEKRRHPVAEAAHKVGESSVEVGAYYFSHVLGLKEHIVEQQFPKLGLRFFFPAGDNSRIDQRLEFGGKRFAPNPSYQLDRGRFENFLGSQCRELGVQLIDDAEVKEVALGRFGRSHAVTYQQAREPQSINTRWVVDATGRRAILKRQLQLEKPSPHVGNAAWFRIDRHIKVDHWSDDPAWRAGHDGATERFYSTNHLMGPGYWVWLIPLASGSISVGIVASPKYHSLTDFNTLEKAVRWLEKHEPQCAAAVKENLDGVQDFLAIKQYPLECKQVFSARRWGIVGEAGFFLDPFYSPGSDFIAFANSFLTDLIRRDLTGKEFRIRAFAYDRIYKKFHHGTAVAYQDQYGLFGNPQVMPVKILWDYLVYWSITAFIYMQGQMCRQTMYIQNLRQLTRLGKLNHYMQEFFRKWHDQTRDVTASGIANVSDMAIVREWNARLNEPMSNRQFSQNNL